MWRNAPVEEREKAHATSATMLEYWLGRIRKEEAAERLQVPLLRVWQLSQMAVAGMLAGLLKQPRTRQKGAPMSSERTELERLRKENAKLRREKELAESLVELLRSFPGREEREGEGRKPSGRPKKPIGGKKAKRTSSGTKAATKKTARPPTTDRDVGPGEATPEG